MPVLIGDHPPGGIIMSWFAMMSIPAAKSDPLIGNFVSLSNRLINKGCIEAAAITI
jgi:hypothetical protein